MLSTTSLPAMAAAQCCQHAPQNSTPASQVSKRWQTLTTHSAQVPLLLLAPPLMDAAQRILTLARASTSSAPMARTFLPPQRRTRPQSPTRRATAAQERQLAQLPPAQQARRRRRTLTRLSVLLTPQLAMQHAARPIPRSAEVSLSLVVQVSTIHPLDSMLIHQRQSRMLGRTWLPTRQTRTKIAVSHWRNAQTTHQHIKRQASPQPLCQWPPL